MAAGIIVAVISALNTMELLSYDKYRDAAGLLSEHPLLSQLFTFYLAIIWIYFFVFFWTQAGQTLGMRAWKLHIRNAKNGNPITVTQALIRLSTSLFGLANLTILFNSQKQPCHDIWSKTKIVVLNDNSV
ncbi:hypothetical protein CF67_09002 [Candidatus Photodesmus blepharus]|uniref:RDD domain-containing protein n=2 Tax=Candidatus Photodesmus blepharonis TaxID=1179155 RepID=A0A084CM08_9GAMM|nr:hypothetical protein CF67_09002 [Candidatus Photodesmus blepharus]